MVGLIYAVGIGVPAWFVCVAALRGAPPAEPQPTRPARAKTIAPAVPNPSPMRALAIATLYFAVAISVGALLLAAAHGGLASALGKLADELAPLIRDVKGATTSLPEGLDPDRLARVIVRVMVPAMAGSGLLLVMANLWLAARIVQISARLPTTWPDIPYNLRLPVPFAAALIPGNWIDLRRPRDRLRRFHRRDGSCDRIVAARSCRDARSHARHVGAIATSVRRLSRHVLYPTLADGGFCTRRPCRCGAGPTRAQAPAPIDSPHPTLIKSEKTRCK